MADLDFKFPDEVENANPTDKTEPVDASDIEVEIVDDTPPADRGRDPLPKEIVNELEQDDLEEYSDKVKKRLGQMKKVWHDERRVKESAIREREEAFNYARAKEQEIKELRGKLGRGEQIFVTEVTKATTNEIAAAKDRLKRAYEAGDAEMITDAQEELTDAKLKLRDVQNIRPALQEELSSVETKYEQAQPPQPRQVIDPKAEAWRQENTWFGVDEEMTSLALGLHEKLVRSGLDPRSNEYYTAVNSTMRKRFPEQFEDTPSEETDSKQARKKPAPIVAPVTRSTAPNRVRLTATQVVLAKKLGLSPEMYAKEVVKLGNYNG
tara:strand:- start:175 stop:1143 length:969 start_codon:yes stop_codon:yes gene_type:complete